MTSKRSVHGEAAMFSIFFFYLNLVESKDMEPEDLKKRVYFRKERLKIGKGLYHF